MLSSACLTVIEAYSTSGQHLHGGRGDRREGRVVVAGLERLGETANAVLQSFFGHHTYVPDCAVSHASRTGRLEAEGVPLILGHELEELGMITDDFGDERAIGEHGAAARADLGERAADEL